MSRLRIILLALLIASPLSAQYELRTESKRAIKFYKLGRSSYGLQDYAMAEHYLKQAIDADDKFQNAYLVLAEVCWDQRKLDDAVEYYSKGLSIDSTFYPRGFLSKGKLEIRIARYDDALGSFQTFLRLVPEGSSNVPEAQRLVRHARFGIYALANPVEFEPVGMGPRINSQYDEYWPSLSADGQTMVVTRLVEFYDVALGRSIQEDFFVSRFKDGNWSEMRSLGSPLNTADNEGAQSISADGSMMVYTVCNRRGVIGRCDIYYAENQGGQWTEPKNLGEPVNTVSKETQPSLSPDGRTLYFASDRPGGKGKLDIWVSTRNDDGNWSAPKNLGDSVNTGGDEMSPFIHHDNQTLYFASETHIGMGGFDIFVTRKDPEGKFLNVTNLGYPINTSGDEFGMIVNAKGNEAYYASNREAGKGRDIFRFELHPEARPVEVSYMKGKVLDDDSRKRLRAEFQLYSLPEGKLINRSWSDERTGEFLLCIPTNKNYMLNVNKRGYLFYSDNFSLEGVYHLEKPFLKDVPLKPVRQGESIILRNIFYETDSYELKPESEHELNKLIMFLTNNPDIRIEISGHTDNTGSNDYNLNLSERRAQSVVTFLTENGVSMDRLRYKGYGFSVSIDTNATPEGRANNRRTELRILD